MSYSDILYSVEDHIAMLTFNRPERMNAMCGMLVEESTDALRQAQADRDVRVIIVTGAGGRAFSAGGICNASRAAMNRRRMNAGRDCSARSSLS